MKKDEELMSKNEEIQRLERKLQEMKRTHKRTVQELDVRIQQEMYLARELSYSEPHPPNSCRKVAKTTKRKLQKT